MSLKLYDLLFWHGYQLSRNNIDLGMSDDNPFMSGSAGYKGWMAAIEGITNGH